MVSAHARHLIQSLPVTLLGLLTLVATVSLAATARAQTPPIVTTTDSRPLAELVTAVSLQSPADVNQRPTCERFRLPCESPGTVPDGGIAGVLGVFPLDRVGLIGELSAYADPWVAPGGDCRPVGYATPPRCGIDQTDRVVSALAGVRVRTPLLGRRTHGLRVFAQILGGVEWSDIVPAHPVLQPGIGLDRYVWNHAAIVHLEYDYRSASGGGRNLSTGRFLIGLGVPIGWL